jgi:3D-(3,5/4)-trihydroxycyclohexane-1,2-dione acylhydrolase (decyclizing)
LKQASVGGAVPGAARSQIVTAAAAAARTTAQAIILFLSNQYVERDGVEMPFFAACWGIFGHGNVAGIGQALQQYSDRFRYYQARNEQAMVHAAVAYAKMKNRMQAFGCTSSIGPGATNMITGAAVATVNRIPVLLLPGDIFAERLQAPVLQQLEWEHSQDISVNGSDLIQWPFRCILCDQLIEICGQWQNAEDDLP